MKKIFVTILFLIILLGSANEVFATKLPENEVKALRQTFKTMKVRFDGMIELPDGTKYIPVFPLQEKAQNPTKVIMTLPKNKPLNQKPDFFMFNTNFAFFKVIKKDESKTTVTYSDSIPMDVKMGLLPQDLLVPTGFEMPGELRIIVGDLMIPILPNKDFKEVNLITGKDVDNSPRTQLVAQAAQQVANKYFYTTSFNKNTVNVLNADNGKAFKRIEFSSIPSDIKYTTDGYLLVSTWKNGNIFVVDAAKAKVLKEIKVGTKPSYITISGSENLAYVANRGESAISVIDLTSMQVLDPIAVNGRPSYIQVADDGLTLYYLDAVAGIVYQLTKTDKYFTPSNIKALFRTNNIAKIQYLNDKIYTLDRGKNELDIYYLKGKPQKDCVVKDFDITPVEVEETVVDNEKNVENIKTEKTKKKASKKHSKNGVEEAITEENKEQVATLTSESEDSLEQPAVATTSDIEDIPFQDEQKHKKKFDIKATSKKAFRALLYYKEDDVAEGQALNPENQVEVLTQNTEEYEPDAEPEKKVSRWTKAKTMFLDYMKYVPDEPEITPVEAIKLSADKQMDFIKLQERANDFVIINDKLYLLCSDDYIIKVYDLNTIKNIDTIELDKVGYYNSIKVSEDKTTGILTNISSKELILFDTETDKVIQKLPVSVDVHNVVITGKK